MGSGKKSREKFGLEIERNRSKVLQLLAILLSFLTGDKCFTSHALDIAARLYLFLNIYL
jgi:hypothetical protein